MIKFKCSCGHDSLALDGVPKTCVECGAVVTVSETGNSLPVLPVGGSTAADDGQAKKGNTTMRSIYDLTTSELVEQYNKATADKGINPVTKFKDVKTGQARLFAVLKSEEVDLPEVTGKAAKGKKAAAPKKEKKAAPVKAKKEKAPKEKATNDDEFGVRIGSNRNKLFNLLKKAPGKAIPLAKAIEAVYGAGVDGAGPIGGVIKGCELTAKNGGYSLAKEGKGKNMTLTLVAN